MGEMDLELARRFVDRILELEPQNFEAREMLGIIEVEEGNIPAARTVRTILALVLIHFPAWRLGCEEC